MSPIDVPTRETIRRYLLGQLPPAEREAIEAKYFADEEFFALVDFEAEGLADAATRGQLSPDEQEQFAAVAGSAMWQRRLEFANHLAYALKQSQPASGSALARAFTRLRASFSSLGMPLQLVAAAVTAVLTLGWPLLLVQSSRTEAALKLQRVDATQSLDSAMARFDSTTSEAQRRVALLERELANATTTKMLLIPGATRGTGDIVRVAPGATYLELELANDEPVAFDTVRVSVRDDAERLLRRELLRGARSSTPVLRLPAAILTDGDYAITVEGVRQASEPVVIARYVLRLRR